MDTFNTAALISPGALLHKTATASPPALVPNKAVLSGEEKPTECNFIKDDLRSCRK